MQGRNAQFQLEIAAVQDGVTTPRLIFTRAVSYDSTVQAYSLSLFPVTWVPMIVNELEQLSTFEIHNPSHGGIGFTIFIFIFPYSLILHDCPNVSPRARPNFEPF